MLFGILEVEVDTAFQNKRRGYINIRIINNLMKEKQYITIILEYAFTKMGTMATITLMSLFICYGGSHQKS